MIFQSDAYTIKTVIYRSFCFKLYRDFHSEIQPSMLVCCIIFLKKKPQREIHLMMLCFPNFIEYAVHVWDRWNLVWIYPAVIAKMQLSDRIKIWKNSVEVPSLCWVFHTYSLYFNVPDRVSLYPLNICLILISIIIRYTFWLSTIQR